ncbi:peptide deformylase 1a chloroplastic [Phtheirospermum japonicum]|uniref:Peptide deformylase n=1 Tax=Phtheirospermum japonicum TaxID=374723 RepID=A0A830C899_9LAMI|nr:peptide deformylase 1a chloroplastic [Phtheirospermum japonicum]
MDTKLVEDLRESKLNGVYDPIRGLRNNITWILLDKVNGAFGKDFTVDDITARVQPLERRYMYFHMMLGNKHCIWDHETNKVQAPDWLVRFWNDVAGDAEFTAAYLKHGEPLFAPRRNHTSVVAVRAGWFLGMGEKKNALPDIVKAGDPVLHEPAQEVRPEEIGSERVQKIIDDMVKAMRKATGVGLAAPQIGIPLRVVINPQLKQRGDKTAFFFEGCLSVDGFRALVERHLEVDVTGFDRDGQAIKVNASGWQARIFQHECDHLDGTLYVDKMVPRTFRTINNLDLPLAIGCPKLGVC